MNIILDAYPHIPILQERNDRNNTTYKMLFLLLQFSVVRSSNPNRLLFVCEG